MDLFWKYFEDLFIFIIDIDNDFLVDIGIIVFEELDIEIIVKEILDVIDNFKRDKLYGFDYILNEYFIEFKGIFMLCLYSIFNCILLFGYFFI